jgi:hypothetical protein
MLLFKQLYVAHMLAVVVPVLGMVTFVGLYSYWPGSAVVSHFKLTAYLARCIPQQTW